MISCDPSIGTYEISTPPRRQRPDFGRVRAETGRTRRKSSLRARFDEHRANFGSGSIGPDFDPVWPGLDQLLVIVHCHASLVRSRPNFGRIWPPREAEAERFGERSPKQISGLPDASAALSAPKLAIPFRFRSTALVCPLQGCCYCCVVWVRVATAPGQDAKASSQMSWRQEGTRILVDSAISSVFGVRL